MVPDKKVLDKWKTFFGASNYFYCYWFAEYTGADISLVNQSIIMIHENIEIFTNMNQQNYLILKHLLV